MKNEVLEYLNKLPVHEKNALEQLREQILKIMPTLDERLSRGVPFFYYKGKRAVGFRSSKQHLSFFIMEGNVFKDLKDIIKNYDSSSTVIRFTAENTLPQELIEKLVVARIREIESKGKTPSKV